MLRNWKTVLPPIVKIGNKPVYTKIAEALINEITSGRLQPGSVLPGSRELALHYNNSRQTVLHAINILVSKGWLYTIAQKGTFISQRDKWPMEIASQKQLTTYVPAFKFKQFTTALSFLKDTGKGPKIRFDDGFADLKLSPVKKLMSTYRSLYEQHLRIRKVESYSVDGPEQLLYELNQMLKQHRGLSIDSEHSCFVRGNQMTFYLAAHILLDRGDWVAVEHPGNLFAWDIFKQTGANLVSIPVDHAGICTEQLERLCMTKKIKAVYVTPQCQYPTTVILSEERRSRLLELAHKYDFVIIESDYEHEFWFDKEPVLPLIAGRLEDRIIYIGSLSRMLNPLMRVGFVAGPTGFIESLKSLVTSIDSCGDFVLEKTVATLMAEGTIAQFIRKSATIYKERRDMMDMLLSQLFGDAIGYKQPPGGLAFWFRFNKPTDIQSLIIRIHSGGVLVPPLQLYNFPGERVIPALRLGFGSVSPKEMETGLRLIRRLIN